MGSHKGVKNSARFFLFRSFSTGVEPGFVNDVSLKNASYIFDVLLPLSKRTKRWLSFFKN